METAPAIVPGGCTQPGDFSGKGGRLPAGTERQSLREQLSYVERRLGAPERIERYKLSDGEVVEFRFYRRASTSPPGRLSAWWSIFRRRTVTSGAPAPLVVAIRDGAVIMAAAQSLYQLVVTRTDAVPV